MRHVLAVLVAALMLFACTAHADSLQPIPSLTGHVVDTTGTLSPAEASELETALATLERERGAQVVVLMVPTVAPEPIEQFGIRAGEAWKLGRKGVDDGAILLVALRDHRVRIEVGRGLEGALNDATSKRIIAEAITPRFKKNDYIGGLRAGIDSVSKVVRSEVLPAGSASEATEEKEEPWSDRQSAATLTAILMYFGLGRLLIYFFGVVRGASAAAVIVALAIGIGFSSLLGAAIAGVIAFCVAFWQSFASGGFFGRFGRGGGSGGGGFSGGGGSFGGGGASGDW